MGNPKFLEYRGLKFTRDEKTGYYLNSTNKVRMHVYVWQCEVGEIPKGYEIHHINRNKADNRIENLRLMKAEEHRKLHAQMRTDEEKERMRRTFEEKVRPKSVEWHKSEEGRQWHRDHYNPESLRAKEKKVCDNCGKEFVNLKWTRFCSNACKSAWRRKEGLDNVERVCEMCGRTFIVSKYSKQRFCSKKCGSEHHSIVNEEKRKEGIPVGRPKKNIGG